MKIKNIIFIAVYISILISCTHKNSYDNSESFNFSDFKEEITLNGSELELDPSVLKPLSIYIIDSLLVLTNVETEFLIEKYNLNSLKKEGECIPFGNGPEEMLAPIKILKENDDLWILDGSKQEFIKYNTSEFCSNEPFTSQEKISIKEFLSDIILLNNKKIVSTLLNPESKRLTFFSEKGELLDTKGEYPSYSGEECTELEKKSGYVCSIATNLHKNKIVAAYKQTDLIEIYDENGNLLKRKHGPELFFPAVSQKSIGEGMTVKSKLGESRDAYFSPIIYNNEIYVLYSGKKYIPNGHTYLNDKILVFDWDGNPQRIYKLDHPIFKFTIDPNTQIIYGISDDPEFHIVKFQL